MTKLTARQLINNASLSITKVDAKLLLSHLLNWRPEDLITKSDSVLSGDKVEMYNRLVEKLAAGYPLAYIIGKQGFWKFELYVNSAVLIPRSDTECLVEAALQYRPTSILDLGTGSGAIACALAFENPEAIVLAVDKSTSALQVAAKNKAKINLGNLYFAASDWLQALGTNVQFDMIISNPPYINSEDLHLKQTSLPFEPETALVSDNKGLADLYTIIQQAYNYLSSNGVLLLEHGYDQQDAVASYMGQCGYTGIERHNDYGGNPRVVSGRKKG